MTVDRATYRAWEGSPRPGRGAALAIATTMVRRLMRLRLVRMVSLAVPAGACVLAGGVLLAFQEGMGSGQLRQFLTQATGNQLELLAIINRGFQQSIPTFAILLGALTGAPLIAEDRRSHSLPLYFSRPISHFDYVAGKLLTVGFFLSLLLIVPPIVLYLLQVGFSDAEGAFVKQFPILARSLVPSVALVITISAVALGVSSLTRRSNYAVLYFFALAMLTWLLAEFLVRHVFQDPGWYALSPFKSVRRIAIEMLPMPEQFERGNRLLREMPVSAAWTGLAIWTGTSLAVLAARIRNVEVVT